MAPKLPGNAKWKIPEIPADVNESAVLLLLSENKQGEISLLITLRSGNLPTHAGQLSLPGGRIDPGEGIIEAALRETHEEVGIPPEVPEILGRLSPLYVHHSGNLIHPVLAWVDRLPEFKLNPQEVAEAFSVSLDELTSDSYIRQEEWELRGQKMVVPFWDFHSVPLWGATAMILSEFCALLRDVSPD